jgi:hypothetical protein
VRTKSMGIKKQSRCCQKKGQTVCFDVITN